MAATFDPQGEPAIRVVMMPRDTNAHGTIFGGIILSYIDQAGFVAASALAAHRYVTVAMDHIEFHQPVYVGDIVSFYTNIRRVGRTSITIEITVVADRRLQQPGTRVKVTEAVVTYVAVDEQGRPTPIRSS